MTEWIPVRSSSWTPNFVVKDSKLIEEFTNILLDTKSAFGDMKECGYSGSIIVFYNNGTNSPEIFYNCECGQLEYNTYIQQIIGILDEPEKKRLEEWLNNIDY